MNVGSRPHMPVARRIIRHILVGLPAITGLVALTWALAHLARPLLARFEPFLVGNAWLLAATTLSLTLCSLALSALAMYQWMRMYRAVQARAAVEERIRQQHDTLRNLLDLLPAAVWSIRTDYTFALVNAAFRERFGDPGRLRCHEVFHGLQAPCPFCLVFTGDNVAGPSRRDHVDLGGYAFTVSRLQIHADGATQQLFVAMSIEEHIKAERALREAENHLQMAQQVARLGSWSVRLSDQRLTLSPEIRRLLGLPATETLPTNRELYNWVMPEDQPALRQVLSDIHRGCRQQVEIQVGILARGNDQRRVIIRVQAMQDDAGEFVEMVGTVQDVTEQVRTQRALRRSEELLRAVQSIATVGGWEYDVRSGEIVGTDELYHIVGADPRPELTAVRLLGWYSPADRPDMARVFWHAVYEGIAYDQEARIITEGGQERWIRCLAQPVIRESNVEQVRGVWMDITERKHAEEDREQLIQELSGALTQVKQLSGLLPICASCKRIRTDEGYWQDVEDYLREHSRAELSPGLCPSCRMRLRGESGTRGSRGVDSIET